MRATPRLLLLTPTFRLVAALRPPRPPPRRAATRATEDPSSARPGLLYVWAPVDAVTSDVFREWRHSVRERFTVVTARDLDPDFMEMVEGEPKRQYPQGRQEYEGMEAALIERAAWLLGWHPRMRSSQLACAILEANGRPCQYLSECVRG